MTSILLSKLIRWQTRSGFGLQWCSLYDIALLFRSFYFMYNYLFAIQEMIAYPLSAFCICKLLPFSLYNTENSSTWRFIKVTVWINSCFSMWKTGKDHCRLYYKLQSYKSKGMIDIWNDWQLTHTDDREQIWMIKSCWPQLQYISKSSFVNIECVKCLFLM